MTNQASDSVISYGQYITLINPMVCYRHCRDLHRSTQIPFVAEVWPNFTTHDRDHSLTDEPPPKATGCRDELARLSPLLDGRLRRTNSMFPKNCE